ncbi:hypothetical protein C7S16_5048 [Burkholderia thailandensis]|uniref:Uncharacterized protein n=1 Tax=Burkholderia thailandensis TaxID=57975 RepID=A0AAW9CV10_BURTH|nr:hypothetical protein [Burkholderia thailandensis]
MRDAHETSPNRANRAERTGTTQARSRSRKRRRPMRPDHRHFARPNQPPAWAATPHATNRPARHDGLHAAWKCGIGMSRHALSRRSPTP